MVDGNARWECTEERERHACRGKMGCPACKTLHIGNVFLLRLCHVVLYGEVGIILTVHEEIDSEEKRFPPCIYRAGPNPEHLVASPALVLHQLSSVRCTCTNLGVDESRAGPRGGL